MQHSTPAIVLLILLFVGPVLFFIRRASRGQKIFIRRIPGIDAIDEAVGRSVELGRPVSFSTALTGIGPLFAACLGVLRSIAEKTARFHTRLFVPCGDAESLVLADAAVQSAYRAQNRYSNYDPTSLRYLSSEQFAFASGYIGLIQRENVGAAFLFGSFAAESLILAEAGQRIGAVQVAATTDSAQIPFFITVCDYTLIGEELYSAGAYLSDDPVQTGSVRGQDFAKLVLLLLVALGIVQATFAAVNGKSGEPVALQQWLQKPWTVAAPEQQQNNPQS
jgi:hypothetical protein